MEQNTHILWNPHMAICLCKDTKAVHLRNSSLLTNSARTAAHTYVKKINLNLYFTHYVKINHKWKKCKAITSRKKHRKSL